MSDRIGLEVEAAAQQIRRELQTSSKEAIDAEKMLEQMTAELTNRKLSGGYRHFQNLLNRANQISPNKGQQGQNGQNKPNAPNNPQSAHGWINQNAMPSASQWGGAVGGALTGNFSGLLQTAGQAIGTVIGGPIGAFMGALAGAVVGKVADKITDAINTAEKNLISTSYLRRSIGGNPADSERLYKSMTGVSSRVGGLLNEETIELFKTISKVSGTSNLSQLESDAERSARLGKALGTDVSRAGQFYGQMRGLGIARNEIQMRQMGMVIGETIGRSKTFAKADEVMGAVSNFALMSTRLTLSDTTQAVSNYAGLMSEMLLGDNKDVAGVSGLLGQVDSSFRSGGGMGVPSNILRLMGYQSFYSSRVNALDLRMMNEQGAFGIGADIFKKGNKYHEFGTAAEKRRDDEIYADIVRRGAQNRSGIEIEIENLEKRTGGGRKLGYSLANDLGITYSQAIDLYNAVKRYEKTGGVGNMLRDRYGLTGMDETQTMKAAMYMDADRESLIKGANDLLSGKGFIGSLSDSDRDALEKAVKSGNEQELRRIVTMTAGRVKWSKDHGEIIENTTKTIENNLERIGVTLIPLKKGVNELKGYVLDSLVNPDPTGGEGFTIGDYSEDGSGAAVEGDEAVNAGYLKRRGTRYQFGVYDCSKYISDLIVGDPTIPSKAKDRLRGQSSEGIITSVASMTGGVVMGDKLSPENIRPGTAIGIDTGKRGFDAGRKYGIDHIVYVYRDPTTGVLMVTQNSKFDYGGSGVSNKGVQAMPYAEYYRKYKKNNHFYGAYVGGLRGGTKNTINPVDEVAPPEIREKIKESVVEGFDESGAIQNGFDFLINGSLEDQDGQTIGSIEQQTMTIS